MALLGDAAHVARPHVGAGVSKAALNAAWLADALDVSPAAILRPRSPLTRRAPARFGSALVARGRYLGAYLEDPPRAGLKPEPLAVMQAISAPLGEHAGTGGGHCSEPARQKNCPARNVKAAGISTISRPVGRLTFQLVRA